MKLLSKIFVVFILSGFISGCADKKSGMEILIKKTITRYNEALIVAYKDLNITPIQELTTPERAGKTETFITAYLDSGLVMEAKLHRLSFTEIKIEGDKAEAKTSEDWSHVWVEHRSREIKVPEKGTHYAML